MPHRLLVVTAHPDDESGGFGGALMLAHQAGAETFVLCFTDGAAGHFRAGRDGDEELGKLRRAEMDAASELLGVTQHEVLDYPDGELPQQNFLEMVRRGGGADPAMAAAGGADVWLRWRRESAQGPHDGVDGGDGGVPLGGARGIVSGGRTGVRGAEAVLGEHAVCERAGSAGADAGCGDGAVVADAGAGRSGGSEAGGVPESTRRRRACWSGWAIRCGM